MRSLFCCSVCSKGLFSSLGPESLSEKALPFLLTKLSVHSRPRGRNNTQLDLKSSCPLSLVRRSYTAGFIPPLVFWKAVSDRQGRASLCAHPPWLFSEGLRECRLYIRGEFCDTIHPRLSQRGHCLLTVIVLAGISAVHTEWEQSSGNR